MLAIVTIVTAFTTTAAALTWNGTTIGSSGSAASGTSGYTIRLKSGTDTEGCFGYRFSVVDKNGTTKGNEGYPSAIDVYRDVTTGDGTSIYNNYYSASTKWNKKQLINKGLGSTSLTMTRINGQTNASFYTSTSSNTAPYIKFAANLPSCAGMGNWQKNDNNLNPILKKLGFKDGITNLKNGDKVLVEPLFVMQIKGGNYNAMTATESTAMMPTSA